MSFPRMSAPPHLSTGQKHSNMTAVLFVGFVTVGSLLGASSLLAAEAGTELSPQPTAATETNSDTAAKQATGRVARAIFTTGIVDREPVDNLASIPNTVHQVYFFSDLRELAGQIITHRWEYQGQVKAEVKFKVGNGARWRVYSSKNLLPEWTGKWTVTVADENGQAVQVSSFDYTAAAATTEEMANTP